MFEFQLSGGSFVSPRASHLSIFLTFLKSKSYFRNIAECVLLLATRTPEDAVMLYRSGLAPMCNEIVSYGEF